VLTSLADGRIWADRYGDGEPSIFALHGWGRSRHDWSTVLPDRNALAIDLPGFGASPAPETVWTTADYADALAPELAKYSNPVVMGHSFGGRVAVQIAARHPGLLSGVVLTGVPLLRAQAPASKPALKFRTARWLNRRGILSDDRMEKLRQQYGSADYKAATGVMRGVLINAVNEDYREQLAAMNSASLPTYMVWGEHDTAATVPMATRARDLLGDSAHLNVVAGSAHLLDSALAAALNNALDQVTASTTDDGTEV
jgi:pimeloyl-ACP methyl ester carboxylesterase